MAVFQKKPSYNILILFIMKQVYFNAIYIIVCRNRRFMDGTFFTENIGFFLSKK